MNLPEFLNVNNGRGINFDGAFGNQCMDVYRAYLRDVLVLAQSPGVRGAKDVWTTYHVSEFDKVLLVSDMRFGDIVIFKATKDNSFGHIGIFIERKGDIIVVFDQNFPSQGYTDKNGNFIGTGVCKYSNHKTTNLIGALRPKKEIKPPEGGNMSDVPQELQRFGKGTVADLAKYIDELKGFVEGGRRELLDIRQVLKLEANTPHGDVMRRIGDLSVQNSTPVPPSTPGMALPALMGFDLETITFRKTE